MSTSVSKITAERNHRILLELVLKPGNDICADCKARAPRWASYNLGIFICVHCASIHRKIGTHITKVKSITLDGWSKEQVEVMKEKGNVKSNALYNPNEARHPPPTSMMDSERDSDLEKFIRSKYEFRRFMDRKSGTTLQQPVADPWTTSIASLPRSTLPTDTAQIGRKASPGPLPPPKTPENLPPRLKLHPSATIPSLSHNIPPPIRSASQPLPPLTSPDKLTAVLPLRQSGVTQSSIEKPTGQVWQDLISLQGPSQSSSLPLQYSPMGPTTASPFQPQVSVQQPPSTPGNVPNPFSNLSFGQTTPVVTSPGLVPTSSPQFPLVPSSLASPALHLGMTNPFNQTSFFSSSAASTNSTAFSTSSNTFSSSPVLMSTALPASGTPSGQAGTSLQTGALMHASPLPCVSLQTSTQVPGPSFPHAPFIPASPAMAGLAQNPFTPVASLSRTPFVASGATNPFSAMQIGQAEFPGTSPRTAFGTPAFVNQQQPPGSTPGWARQGAHGTF